MYRAAALFLYSIAFLAAVRFLARLMLAQTSSNTTIACFKNNH